MEIDLSFGGEDGMGDTLGGLVMTSGRLAWIVAAKLSQDLSHQYGISINVIPLEL